MIAPAHHYFVISKAAQKQHDQRGGTTNLAEWYRAAEIPAASLLVGLHLSDALSNAISLGLSEGCGDRQEQLADPIARDVAAQVEQVELDALPFCWPRRPLSGVE